MNNIKKFYKEHRVFTILMAIVIVCAILIATVLIQCFYVGNGKDKYGKRLEGLETHEISESRQSDFENNIANNDKVKSADIVVTGKIVYIKLIFEDKVDLVEAESVALKSLEEFSEEEHKIYDFNITLKKNASETSEGFIISGSKNVNGSGLVWNNNRKVADQPVDPNTTERAD